jgi:serine/threonine protein kinase
VSPVIHRDASPQNVLLALNGDVKLADFGMARARDRIAEHTAPGFVKGTLSYMAPEILTGKPATPVSDLFSLACTLWEALAGDRLFHAKADAEVVSLIRKCDVPPLVERRDDIPPALAAAVHRALSPNPADRFVSARQMAHELGEILREGGSWGDADVLVGTAVAETRIAMTNLPPPDPEAGSGRGSGSGSGG